VGAFRYVLFAAVAFSLCVYGYRAYRRWIAPAPPDAPTGADPDASPGPTPSVPPPRVATPLPAAPAKPKRTRGMGFTDPTDLPSQREAAASDSLVQQVIREELARKQGTDPVRAGGSDPAGTAPGRSGLFAGGSSGAGADRVSVAAALTGVRLPDDLVPLVGDVADPHHVTFITSSQPAAAVGRHLGDELERLGFQMRSESDVVAVATKGAVTLRVTLHPEASTERLDGAARFPTAGPTSVVVEFQT
jgi:hypothetical protein